MLLNRLEQPHKGQLFYLFLKLIKINYLYNIHSIYIRCRYLAKVSLKLQDKVKLNKGDNIKINSFYISYSFSDKLFLIPHMIHHTHKPFTIYHYTIHVHVNFAMLNISIIQHTRAVAKEISYLVILSL